MALANLYDLFVSNVFGGFWQAMFGLAFIFLCILAFGGVTGYSMGWFIMFFFLAMALGYGHPIVTIPIVIGILTWVVLQWRRPLEEA